MKNSITHKELIFLALQFLQENNFKESAHQLEKESGLFMDMKYIEDLASKGDWDVMENYLFAFTKMDDNNFSLSMLFAIRRQKYLEALDRDDSTKASDILNNELIIFKELDETVFEELRKLKTYNNIRIRDKLVSYDVKNERVVVCNAIQSLIRDNPVLLNKLEFPVKKNGRLVELINHSFLYQHHIYCKKPHINPEFTSVLVDHLCDQPVDSEHATALTPLGILQPSVHKELTTSMFGNSINNSSILDISQFSPASIDMRVPNNTEIFAKSIQVNHHRVETQQMPRMLMPSRISSKASQPEPMSISKGLSNNPSPQILAPFSSSSVASKAPNNAEIFAKSIIVNHQRVETQQAPRRLIPSRMSTEASQLEPTTTYERLSNGSSPQILAPLSSSCAASKAPNNAETLAKSTLVDHQRAKTQEAPRRLMPSRMSSEASQPKPMAISEGLSNDPSPQTIASFSSSSAASSAPKNSAKRPRTSTENMNIDPQGSKTQNVKRKSLPSGKSVKKLQNGYLFPRMRGAILDNDAGHTTSMDFHPVMQTSLLVGTSTGDVILWDIMRKKKIAVRNFKIWDIKTFSEIVVGNLAGKTNISVNRVTWNSDGSYFGVAYSHRLVHVYHYSGSSDLQDHLEIDAHVGSVNDIVFSHQLERLCIVTCGDDMTVKVWDASTGETKKKFSHEAPVFSICPSEKEKHIISITRDGKIKVLLFDQREPKLSYDAPGNCCTRMLYTTDGSRLFSCGTTNEGNPHLVEWNEQEGYVKMTYQGLENSSNEMVHFSLCRDQYLAVGNAFNIKIWDMDCPQVLTNVKIGTTNPPIQFSRNGLFLALTSTNNDGTKVFGAPEVLPLMRQSDTNIRPATRKKNNRPKSIRDTWKVPGIKEPSQCRSLKLIDSLLTTNWPVSRLAYSHFGEYILALASNGVHTFWRWKPNDKGVRNVTTTEPPLIYRPKSRGMMINELTSENNEYQISHFAITNSDSYLVSLSGASVKIFNMRECKQTRLVCTPPVQARCVAILPRNNNIVAVGMEDSAIGIFNNMSGKVFKINCPLEIMIKLQGHTEAVTGLAFSNSLPVLVSYGADFQLCVWCTNKWRKLVAKFLNNPNEGSSPGINVEFHPDGRHFMVVHEKYVFIHQAPWLEFGGKWIPGKSNITYATYSCDGNLIIATFRDGNVGMIGTHDFQPRCWISPNAYVPQHIRVNASDIFANMIAVHPSDPNQFALATNVGGVYVLEPLESAGLWGKRPEPKENVGTSKAGSSNHQRAIVIREPQPQPSLRTIPGGNIQGSNVDNPIQDIEMREVVPEDLRNTTPCGPATTSGI